MAAAYLLAGSIRPSMDSQPGVESKPVSQRCMPFCLDGKSRPAYNRGSSGRMHHASIRDDGMPTSAIATASAHRSLLGHGARGASGTLEQSESRDRLRRRAGCLPGRADAGLSGRRRSGPSRAAASVRDGILLFTATARLLDWRERWGHSGQDDSSALLMRRHEPEIPGPNTSVRLGL